MISMEMITPIKVLIFYHNSKDRKALLSQYVDQKRIEKIEMNEIIQWECRKAFRLPGLSVVVWQIADFKYKEDSPEKPMKVYLRIYEMKKI